MTCSQLEKQELGDFASHNKASKCPKCKTKVEKIDGCMHLTCPLCKHEWCFICGLPYNSIFHYSQYGGLVCELLGGSFYSKRKWVAVLLTLTIVCFLSILVILFGVLITGAGIWYVSEQGYRKDTCLRRALHYSVPRKDKLYWKLAQLALNLFKALLILIYCLLYIALSLGLGLALGTILVLPCYIMLIIALGCLFYKQKGRKGSSKVDDESPPIKGIEEKPPLNSERSAGIDDLGKIETKNKAMDKNQQAQQPPAGGYNFAAFRQQYQNQPQVPGGAPQQPQVQNFVGGVPPYQANFIYYSGLAAQNNGAALERSWNLSQPPAGVAAGAQPGAPVDRFAQYKQSSAFDRAKSNVPSGAKVSMNERTSIEVSPIMMPGVIYYS